MSQSADEWMHDEIVDVAIAALVVAGGPVVGRSPMREALRAAFSMTIRFKMLVDAGTPPEQAMKLAAEASVQDGGFRKRPDYLTRQHAKFPRTAR